MSHPALNQMHKAQARALHILDTHHGPLNPDLPPIATVIERTNYELAARTRARALLDQPTREWLERLEQEQRNTAGEALGFTPGEVRDATEVDTSELHLALTLADRLQTAPITPE